MCYSIRIYRGESVALPFSGADFSVDSITVTVPADRRQLELPQFFTIFDDDIDETEQQSFAVVAEVGPDVPEAASCSLTFCSDRKRATAISIIDNDRELC